MLHPEIDPLRKVWTACPECGVDDPAGVYLLTVDGHFHCHCSGCFHTWWWQANA